MNKKLLMCSVVCSLIATQGWATDDVYVDLSVLDNMPQDSIGFVPSSPAFPEVQKADIRPQKKAAPIVKKTQAPKAQKKADKSVVEVQPIKPQISESSDNQNSDNHLLNEKQNITSVPHIEEDKHSEITSVSEPLESADSHEQASFSSMEDKASTDAVEPMTTLPAATDVSSKQKDEAISPTPILPPSIVSSEKEEKIDDGKILSAKVSDIEDVDQKKPIMPREVYAISFDSDSSDLSEEHMSYLDKLVDKFDKSQKKKISIKAYNYDNGEDSFRKKRVSLLRATHVRSYLLNRGFKDFSIKIINTTVESDDKNSVEIEEVN